MQRAARALLYDLGPQSFADRVLVAWSRSEAGAADSAWRDLATLPQRWTVPVFSSKPRDFTRRGVAAGPLWVSLCVPPNGPGSRRIFRPTPRRLRRLPIAQRWPSEVR